MTRYQIFYYIPLTGQGGDRQVIAESKDKAIEIFKKLIADEGKPEAIITEVREIGWDEKLYHFTAKRFLKSIKHEGLTRGVMLKNINPPEFLLNKQWLTKKAEFDQGWSIGTGRLQYKRNEVRLTIEIPHDERINLKPWTQMKFLVPLVANELEDSDLADPENWYIYQGRIKPEWITEYKDAL